MRKGMMAGWEALGADRQKGELSFATQVLSGLNSNRPDVANSLLETRAEAAENSGDNNSAKAYRDLAKLVQVSPDNAFIALATQVASLDGGKDAISSILDIREEGRKIDGPQVEFRVLAPEEKKRLGLPEKMTLQIVTGKQEQ